MVATNRDILVLGASMGGVEGLQTLVAGFPAELKAAVFVVQHVMARAISALPQILSQAGPLPARAARDGEEIRPGTILVAPPDHHLLLGQGQVRLSRGPRENRTRPAIDPLFRSAAVAYTSRVMGVVLSGYLDDGTAGLAAIKRCGGLTLVLDPTDTLYPDMPRNALENVAVDHILPLAELPAMLVRLVGEPAGPPSAVPEDLRLESAQLEQVMSREDWNEKFGHMVPLACPECGGPLWHQDKDGLERYRCHLGHGYSAANLLVEQDDSINRALWAALRSLEERRKLLAAMVKTSLDKGRKLSARELTSRAEETAGHIASLQQLLAVPAQSRE